MTSRPTGDTGARRRRSALFAPGSRLDLMAKMSRSSPDCVILDLEDGTPPELKQQGRSTVRQAVAEIDFAGAEVVVRINAVGSAEAEADLAWLRGWPDDAPLPDAIMVPKVEGPDDLDAILAGSGRAFPLWILPTETAVGYAHLAQSVAHPRTTAVIWGAEDLSADIGADGSRETGGRLREVFRAVRAQTLLAAKAAGVAAIDTTYVDLGNLDGLRAEATECAAMGFDGKAAIHPSHIPVINEAFQPTAERVEHATRLVAAFEAAGGGAIRFEGRMVDHPHYAQARRLLQRAGVDPTSARPSR